MNKKKIIFASIISICFISLALAGRDFGKRVSLNKKQVPKIVTLKLTEQQIMVVLNGVKKLPLEESAEVYFYIQGEAVKQLNTQGAITQPQDTAKAKDTTKPKPKK